MPENYKGKSNGPEVDSAINITGSKNIPTYSGSKTYAKNELIVADSSMTATTNVMVMYKSKTAHNPGGTTWAQDKTNWDPTDEYSEIVSLRTDLNTLNSASEKTANKETGYNLSDNTTKYPSSHTVAKYTDPLFQICCVSIEIANKTFQKIVSETLIENDNMFTKIPDGFKFGLVEIGNIPKIPDVVKTIEAQTLTQYSEIREYVPFYYNKKYYIYVNDEDFQGQYHATHLWVPGIVDPSTVFTFMHI